MDLYRRLCSQEVLLEAWGRVKKKGGQGGVDRVDIAKFEKDLDRNIATLAREKT